MHCNKQDAAHLLHPCKHQAEAALGSQALQQVCNVIAPLLQELASGFSSSIALVGLLYLLFHNSQHRPAYEVRASACMLS